MIEGFPDVMMKCYELGGIVALQQRHLNLSKPMIGFRFPVSKHVQPRNAIEIRPSHPL